MSWPGGSIPAQAKQNPGECPPRYNRLFTRHTRLKEAVTEVATDMAHLLDGGDDTLTDLHTRLVNAVANDGKQPPAEEVGDHYEDYYFA